MARPRCRLSQDALDALSAYDYPGNVRELENILERALIYGEGETITAADLGLAGGSRGGGCRWKGRRTRAVRPARVRLRGRGS